MEQATQPTTTTAPTEQDTGRAAYQRAKAVADRLVDQVTVLPTSVETHRYLTRDAFAVRLHFGTGLAAGRGVLTAAALVDAEVTRDNERDVVWIEAHATVDGIEVIARSLVNAEDADELLPPADTVAAEETAEDPTEVTQPMPAVGTDPAAITAPAIFAVRPLASMKVVAPESSK